MMCKCKNKNKKQWWVRQWKAYWHYIGTNRTPRQAKSSLVECIGCQSVWRTSAGYVDGLARKYNTPYISSLSGDIVFK